MKGGIAMPYWIIADIGSDLPAHFVERYQQFQVLPQPYTLDGVEGSYKPGDENELGAFYQKLRKGHPATTSQITVQTFYDAFKQVTSKGDPLLCVVLSSGISGSYQSAVLARTMVLEEDPTAHIALVDSLSASLGYGLLMQYILENRKQGMSLEDNEKWALENRLNLNHWFTVDDLDFLFRGGRVTRSAALLGGMLRIKPVLHVNDEGKLIPREKVQGRKKSLRVLVDKLVELSVPKEGQNYFISHGDCLEDAQFVADLIRQAVPSAGEILISPVGAVIGSHSGPGTLAIFFMGKGR